MNITTFNVNATPKLIENLTIKNGVNIDIWGRQLNAIQDMPAYVHVGINCFPLYATLMVSPVQARELAAMLIAQAEFAEAMQVAA